MLARGRSRHAIRLGLRTSGHRDTVHFGSRTLANYTPAQMERIMPLLRDMIALMGFLFALYFAVNVHSLVRQSLSSVPREVVRAIVPLDPWLIVGLLAGQGATVFYYLRRFDAAASSETPDNNGGN